MPSLLRKVKSRLFIQVRRAAFHQLDGHYRSQARGRGMDFDDLREYAAGDDVRDIDWKATARSTSTLVKRYHAERKQVVTFVVNTSRSMAAATQTQEVKRDVAVVTVGTIGYLTTKHGDDVSMIHGDSAGIYRLRAGRSDAHLERLLRAVDDSAGIASGKGATLELLNYVTRSVRRRTILTVITDEVPLDDAGLDAVRQLRSRHELLWVTIGDADLDGVNGGKPIVDIDVMTPLPEYLRVKRHLRTAAKTSREMERQLREKAFGELGVAHTLIHSESDILPALISLFAQRGHARG